MSLFRKKEDEEKAIEALAQFDNLEDENIEQEIQKLENIEEQQLQEKIQEKQFIPENLLPENLLEYQKWIVDPAKRAKEKFGIIKKDNALTYMEKDDISISTSMQDLAYQCYSVGQTKAGLYFEFLNDTDVVTGRSYKGFERKQEQTVTQKKEIDISRRKEKGGRIGWQR